MRLTGDLGDNYFVLSDVTFGVPPLKPLELPLLRSPKSSDPFLIMLDMALASVRENLSL